MAQALLAGEEPGHRPAGRERTDRGEPVRQLVAEVRAGLIASAQGMNGAGTGNWNAQGFVKDDPLTIRNFSGAMDDFCVFRRALDAAEIHALYSAGQPQPDSHRPHQN